jgi:leucyl/phenylalanyl-tRNA---protein transferase
MALLPWLDDGAPLPPPAAALGPTSEAPGLVAASASVSLARLEEAYRCGIFPWYSPGQPVLWWSPDPRMVLPAAQFRLHPSLKKTLRRFLRTPGCELRFDHDFGGVITACAQTPREGQDGTWIVPAMVEAYTEWHRQGRVHSVETWVQGRLVGGLYFVNIGRMVYGESMFSHATDASKLALAALVAACRAHGVALIDCQQHTRHLASFGAFELPRNRFTEHVARASVAAAPACWTYDAAHWSLLFNEADAPAAEPPFSAP